MELSDPWGGDADVGYEGLAVIPYLLSPSHTISLSLSACATIYHNNYHYYDGSDSTKNGKHI